MKRALSPLSAVLCALLAVSCSPKSPEPVTVTSTEAVPAAENPMEVPESAAKEPEAEAPTPVPAGSSPATPKPATPKPRTETSASGTATTPAAPPTTPEPASAPPSPEPAPAPAPVAEVPAAPAEPAPAPDLRLEPTSVVRAAPFVVRVGPLPAGTQVRYTLDGSDPAGGKPWPAAGLTVAQSGRLKVWGAQPGGLSTVVESLYTVGEVWVQPGASGDGSWAAPTGTLEDALAKAVSWGIKRVRLTSGQWTVKTVLTGTWELSGGWKSPGELGAGPSVLVGAKGTSTQKDPAYTLRVAPEAKVTLGGLEVRAPNSSFAAAVVVDAGGTAEVTGSRLSGGNGLYGYGLKATGATLVSVVDCILYGGDGGSSFALSADKSTVKVLRSTFDAGTGNAVSYGLNLTLSKLTLVSSVVWGGVANSSYGIGLYSSEGSSIVGSTVLGGKGSSSWAIYSSESDPEILSCLIGSAGKAKSYGIFVNYGKSLPRALRASVFFGAATGAFAGADLGAVSPEPGEGGAFTDAAGRAFGGQKGNAKVEVTLGPAPEFRTPASASTAVTRGGEVLTGDGALDRAGRPRGPNPATGAWAISP